MQRALLAGGKPSVCPEGPHGKTQQWVTARDNRFIRCDALVALYKNDAPIQVPTTEFEREKFGYGMWKNLVRTCGWTTIDPLECMMFYPGRLTSDKPNMKDTDKDGPTST